MASPVSAQETAIYWVVTFPEELIYTEEELNAGFLEFFVEDQRVVELRVRSGCRWTSGSSCSCRSTGSA